MTIDLSGPPLHVLLALGAEPRHGYAIMQRIDAESGGRVRILPGTLYATLKRLLADGLVEECEPPKGESSDDARRRYYRVTRRGRAAVEAELERLSVLVRLGRAFEKPAR
jgi:DNA-binding PadR family transcriptional regulator